MICLLCGAGVVHFDAEKWTHKGVDYSTGVFSHRVIPVKGEAEYGQ